MQVILASTSPTRLELLRRAGVPVAGMASGLEEGELKTELRAAGADAAHCAGRLAEAKARRISHSAGEALVIGADQMLDLDGEWLDKPRDRDAARTQLQRLSGRSHELISAAVVLRADALVWQTTQRARLVMRPLSDRFIEDYLAREGVAVTGTVGGYRLEALGAQLFETVEGDFFTVLGLPLLPLLGFLRRQGVLLS